MRGPDPVALVAALVISALAAAATAARAPSPWWAAPAFVGVASLVLGVHAALSWKPGRARGSGAGLDQIRDLVRQVSKQAGEIRARSLGVPVADTVAAVVGGAVEAAYRLAYLAARTGEPDPAALDALAVAARRMAEVARRVDNPAATRPSALIEDLTLVRLHLENAETEAKSRMRER